MNQKVEIVTPVPVETIVHDVKRKKRAKTKWCSKIVEKECKYCKKTFRYDKYLTHICRCLPTVCFICGANFTYPYLKRRHQLTHDEFKDERKTFKCIRCSKTFSRKDNMMCHAKTTCKRLKVCKKIWCWKLFWLIFFSNHYLFDADKGH